jgi:hypothetical protein
MGDMQRDEDTGDTDIRPPSDTAPADRVSEAHEPRQRRIGRRQGVYVKMPGSG